MARTLVTAEACNKHSLRVPPVRRNQSKRNKGQVALKTGGERREEMQRMPVWVHLILAHRKSLEAGKNRRFHIQPPKHLECLLSFEPLSPRRALRHWSRYRAERNCNYKILHSFPWCLNELRASQAHCYSQLLLLSVNWCALPVPSLHWLLQTFMAILSSAAL